MLSPQLRSDIQKLWDAFWSGGISNPLTAIEQITYLVFLKRIEDLDNLALRQRTRPTSMFEQTFSVGDRTYPGDDFRWSNLIQRTGDDLFAHMRGPVFEWIKEMDDADQERMRDAVFLIPNVNLLTRAMKTIDTLFVNERNQDTLGDIYENLLKEIAVAGKNGQFRTPRHLIRVMCDLVDPKYGERICDPACGTGGFLVNAYQHILKSHTSPDILRFAADGTPIDAIGDRLTPDQHKQLRSNHLHGFDFDRTMVRLGWMNLIQHGLENPDIRYADSLGSIFNERVADGGDLSESFDVVLANPPFTGSIDKSDVGPTLQSLDSTKTELLFVELILQLLRSGRPRRDYRARGRALRLHQCAQGTAPVSWSRRTNCAPWSRCPAASFSPTPASRPRSCCCTRAGGLRPSGSMTWPRTARASTPSVRPSPRATTSGIWPSIIDCARAWTRPPSWTARPGRHGRRWTKRRGPSAMPSPALPRWRKKSGQPRAKTSTQSDHNLSLHKGTSLSL